MTALVRSTASLFIKHGQMSFRSPKGFTVYETYKNDFVALILK